MKRIIASLLLALHISFAQAATTLTSQSSFTPTATAYAAGQCLGAAGSSAVLTISSASSGTGQSGTLYATVMYDRSGQLPQFNILLLDAAAAGTYTDATTCNISTSDAASIIGYTSINGASWMQGGTPGVGVAQFMPLPYVTSGSGNLFAIPIIQGAATFGAAQTVKFTFTFVKD